jgi:hypothetical protein
MAKILESNLQEFFNCDAICLLSSCICPIYEIETSGKHTQKECDALYLQNNVQEGTPKLIGLSNCLTVGFLWGT